MKKTLSIVLSGLLAFNGFTSLSATRVSAETKENIPHVVFDSNATNMKEGDTSQMRLNIENPTDIDYVSLEVDFAYPKGYEIEVLEVGADDESTINNDNVTSITRLGDNARKFIRCAVKYDGGDINYNGTRNYFTIHFKALKDIPHLFKECGDNFKITIVKTDGTIVNNDIVFEGFTAQKPHEAMSAEVTALSNDFSKGTSVPVSVTLKNVANLKNLNIMLYNQGLNKGVITDYLVNENIFPMDSQVNVTEDETGLWLSINVDNEVVFGFEDEMILTFMVNLKEDVDYIANTTDFIKIYGKTADGEFNIVPTLSGMDGSGDSGDTEPNEPTIHDSAVSLNFLDPTDNLEIGDMIKAQLVYNVPAESNEIVTRLRLAEPYAHDLKLLSAELSETAKAQGFTFEFDNEHKELVMTLKNTQNKVLESATSLIDLEFMTTSNKPGLFNPNRNYLSASVSDNNGTAVVEGTSSNLPEFEAYYFALGNGMINSRIIEPKPEYHKGDLVTVDYSAYNISEIKSIMLTQKYTDKLKVVKVNQTLRGFSYDGELSERNNAGVYSLGLVSDSSDISMVDRTSFLDITYEVQEDCVKLFNDNDITFEIAKADGTKATTHTTVLNDNEEPENPGDGDEDNKPQPPIDGGDEDNKPQPPVDGGDEDNKPQPPVDGGDEDNKPVPPTDEDTKPQPPVDGGNGDVPTPPTTDDNGAGGDIVITPDDIPVVDEEGTSEPVKTGDSSNVAKSLVYFGLSGLVLFVGVSADRRRKRA